MKRNLWKIFCLAGLLLVGPFLYAGSLDGPGNIFIRQKAPDGKAYRQAFLDQRAQLKAHGFTAYSLQRDLGDKKTLILTLKCSNLEKGLDFAHSEGFMEALDKAGARIPQVWWGLDETGRTYADQPHPPAKSGIIIARNQVRDYPFWLKCFRSQNHHHEGRQYKNNDYSVHYLPGKPAVAIVVHEASDVSKAPIFMTSDHLNGEMESTGVIGLDIWYGVNIEEGLL